MQTENFQNTTFSSNQKGYLISTGYSGTQIIDIKEMMSFGRETFNSIPLSDPFVSGRHARIEFNKKGFLLRDLQSRNGTYINGAKIVEGYLKPGDRISIGQCEFIFQSKRPKSQNLDILKSKNEEWDKLLKTVPDFSQTDLPVLLLGASGTGKEVLAKSVHDLSTRCRGPFVSVNCSALSDSLIESELFGHKRGSFTGSTENRKGAFEAARGGTLFLDEIGDLPLSLQPKLLRALENKEIRPVGSDKNVNTDVRIIAATHKNLSIQISKQLFRSDLYYRLHVIKLHIPALTDRMEDFDGLLYSFAREMRVRFSFASIQKLKEHTWPGNIRELRNSIARASALFPKSEIQPEHIQHLVDLIPRNSEYSPVPSGFRNGKQALREMEFEMIKDKLIETSGNQRKAAKELGIPKSTLHDRIKNFGIDIKELLETSDLSS